MEPTGRALAKTLNRAVVLVRWGNMSSCDYLYEVQYVVPAVGYSIADLITNFYLNPTKTELIGFSLGAHIAGYAGAALNGRVFRITGKSF